METSSGNRGCCARGVACAEGWACGLLVVHGPGPHKGQCREHHPGQQATRANTGPIHRPGVRGGSPSPTTPRLLKESPLEFWGRLLPNLLLHGLNGLLDIHDELGCFPALCVHGHCLNALHIIGGHHQMVLLR